MCTSQGGCTLQWGHGDQNGVTVPYNKGIRGKNGAIVPYSRAAETNMMLPYPTVTIRKAKTSLSATAQTDFRNKTFTNPIKILTL